MRVLLQRVTESAVKVAGETVGEIQAGVMLLVGFGEGDAEEKLAAMAEKIANLRIFPDERGRFHHSLIETEGGALVVPQFTLYADCSKGRRPEFFGALKPELAAPLVEEFCRALTSAGVKHVSQGQFGANMQVSLINDGPVTIWLES